MYAAKAYSAEFLAECTLVTSVEPCCMCSGGTYWAGIGRVVYGMTEKRLAELTGDNPENLTMDCPASTSSTPGSARSRLSAPSRA